ncbi:MAG TPA: phosphatase PAP2 family protein [Thermoanaerobaculia bacterium]|jgi:membrane-associated phospholipid phosphatase|nr:phosphatase PAP2 family protein [Thermoanaerobaculia bacterium]
MRKGLRVWAAALCFAACAHRATAQVPPAPDETGGKEVAPQVEAPAGPLKRAIRAVAHEAGRYFSDSVGFVIAPAHWTKSDWEKAGGVTLVLGGLFAADRSIDRAAQRNRSDFTNHVADATMSFGGGNGTQAAVLAIGLGLAFRSPAVRDTGREALEASILTALVENTVIKRLFGRERPNRSGGKTDFDFGSSNSSFPSGHATQAFALASVVAARSKGWVVPTAAYTLASLVAFDRVNEHVHFSSDVFAGAVFGTVVGRYIVHKHEREAVGEPTKTSLDIVPIRNGLAARLTF